MSRVKSLSILGTKYKVTYVPENSKKLKVNKQDVVGSQDWLNSVIVINGDMSKERVREVMLHEIVHAVSDELRIGLKENQVLKLGTGLNAFLIDNQKFTKGFLK